MSGVVAPPYPDRIICSGLDRAQYGQLSEIVLRQSGAECVYAESLAAYAGVAAAASTLFIAGFFAAGGEASGLPGAGLHGDGPPRRAVHAPSLAVLPRGSPAASDIYLLGYIDHFAYPFVAEEVEARILSARLLFEAQTKQPRYSGDLLVETTCRFLIENLTYTDGLEALARRMGTNRNSLAQRFRLALSESPMAWLRKQRLLRARSMIEETNRSIIDIALSVGYEDGNNFSTAFRRTFARSPRAHRKQCRNQRK